MSVRLSLAPVLLIVRTGRRVSWNNEHPTVVRLQHSEHARVVVLAGLVAQSSKQFRLQRAELVFERRWSFVERQLFLHKFVALSSQLHQLHTYTHTPSPQLVILTTLLLSDEVYVTFGGVTCTTTFTQKCHCESEYISYSTSTSVNAIKNHIAQQSQSQSKQQKRQRHVVYSVASRIPL